LCFFTSAGLFTYLATLTIFAGLALLERWMISQRTKSAFNAKKTRGEKLGRPVALTPSQIREEIGMINDGKGA
jgi:DNA invertase Pin-like site-specific DNA recombinase